MNKARVVRILSEMRDLLVQADEPGWAEQLDRLAMSLQAVQAEQVRQVARQGLALFGGMGSLSDLVVCVHNSPDPELNGRLDAMRQALHAGLVALIADGTG